MSLPTRRAVLAGALAFAPGLAAAAGRPPGLIAAPEVAALLDGLARIDDGNPEGPRVRILFSPGCGHSLRMFEAVQARRMAAAWRWVPYGGSPAARAASAAALAAGDMGTLESVLRGRAVAPGGDVGRMAAQDAAVSGRLARLLYDATNTALGTPTQVYRRQDGLYMAARGSLQPDRLDDLLGEAA